MWLCLCLSPQSQPSVQFTSVTVPASIPESPHHQQQQAVFPVGLNLCSYTPQTAGMMWTFAHTSNAIFPQRHQIPSVLCVLCFQDVSCNELQSLPPELGQLECLRDLNLRRNQLTTLPEGKHSHPISTATNSAPLQHFSVLVNEENNGNKHFNVEDLCISATNLIIQIHLCHCNFKMTLLWNVFTN